MPLWVSDFLGDTLDLDSAEVGAIRMTVGDLIANEEIVAELMKDVGTLNAIFDAYTFGRMFKKMEPAQEKIVLYIGEEHAKIFRILLKELGFSMKIKKSNEFGKDFQCLDTERFGTFFEQEKEKK